MPVDAEQGNDFRLAEYRESANAYFKGVDIGWTGLRSYITVNALFVALLSALAEPKGQLLATAEIVKLVPFFALIATVAIASVAPHYFRHLENCRKRCQEIEEQMGGKLFTRLGTIAGADVPGRRRYKIRSTFVLILLIGSILLFWTYFAIKNYYPDFELMKFLDTKVSVCAAVSENYGWLCRR